MAALYTNNASTILASGITNSATSLTVASGQGSQFPSPTGIDYFLCTIQSVTNSNREIVKCTSRSGDTLTIVRAQEGTTAYAFNTNDVIELRITAAEMTQINQIGPGNASIMKNRIINGAMVIDQRNSGASVTQTTAVNYSVDRWFVYGTVTSKFTAQQNAGSITPPAGFINYIGCVSSSAYSVSASDTFQVSQRIEGLNITDLGWGTANAKTVTLSFWAYSSLTGTFGGSLQNSAGNRSYPFSYSIPVANTWTQISITIAGDTTGTWLTTNGSGIQLSFSLGVGSTGSGTAGAWASSNYLSATGATSVVGTSGATFYITGVQLEVGSSATGFEYRQYGQELALCQRYFLNLYGGSGAALPYAMGYNTSTTSARTLISIPVSMRSIPTYTSSGGTDVIVSNGSTINVTSTSVNSSAPNAIYVIYTVASGLTAYQTCGLQTPTNQVTLSAEL